LIHSKLKYFPEDLKRRTAAGDRYSEELKDCPGITTPVVKEGRTHTYGQYTLRCCNREELIAHLKEAGIPTAIHYPKSLHLQDVFLPLGGKEGDFPESEKASKEVFSLRENRRTHSKI